MYHAISLKTAIYPGTILVYISANEIYGIPNYYAF